MFRRHNLELIIGVSILFCGWTVLRYYFQFNENAISNDPDKWGVFGDYVGGIVGSIFSLISVVLIYFTFREQRKTSERDKFENKYYELIKLHRDNVAEIQLGEGNGKKTFVLILREFREALKIVKDISRSHSKTFENAKLIELAYLTIFYGTGPNSTRVLKSSLPEYEKDFLDELTDTLHAKKDEIKLDRKLAFVPFEGHQHRLGHYFRHLYQTISFVHRTASLTIEEKKEYVKTIRAQLSNHEQALLFFNSLSKIGRPWKTDGLIVEYSLIKNLPKSFIDENTEIDVKAVYPSITFEFEEAYPII